MKKLLQLILLICLILPANSFAEVTIDITRGNSKALPIAITNFASSDAESKKMAAQIVSVVENDLRSSGLFNLIDKASFLQDILSHNDEPEFISWRQLNASALVVGDVKMTEDDKFSVKFRMWDVFGEKQLAGKSYTAKKEKWRRIPHLIADQIYSRLTGENGYFDSRVVYVSESGPPYKRIKRLAFMDQDGANHRYLTSGKNLVLTPRFSMKSQKVIYMSYSGGIPKVYMLDLDEGDRRLVGTFPGMSFAPRFSPDGEKVILSASLDGNSEIYSMDLGTGAKKRLTYDSAIDTSPSYSPDGKKIVFNSDRGGSQQIYIMNSDGTSPVRISYGGGSYATPVWSPKGDMIAFTKMSKGKFYIGAMRTDGTGEKILTESYLDEGPTWSPNGRVIMFARQDKNKRNRKGEWQLYSVDLTGSNERLIKTPKDASDPAWSPNL